MPRTFTVFYLGQLPDIDPTENNHIAENAATLNGMTFGSAGNEIFLSAAEFSPGPDGYTQPSTGGTYQYDSGYDQSNNPSEQFRIDGGTPQTFDSFVVYHAEITYTDGSPPVQITANIFQDTAGNTYWAPETLTNADHAAMEAKPIQSIKLVSVESDFWGGMAANRREWNFVTCFCAGSLIMTAKGPRPVETLKASDLIVTGDNGLQPVLWIGAQRIDRQNLAEHPNLRPIRIRRSALGSGLPEADLLVSPQHRILVRSRIAMRMFGQREVLVAAKHLRELPGVETVEDAEGAHYFHLLFRQHEIIRANGLEAESFFIGPEPLKNLPEDDLSEIHQLFPALSQAKPRYPDPARPLVNGRRGRKLAHRHAKNAIPLVEDSALPIPHKPIHTVREHMSAW